jgi:hypothetical protein
MHRMPPTTEPLSRNLIQATLTNHLFDFLGLLVVIGPCRFQVCHIQIEVMFEGAGIGEAESAPLQQAGQGVARISGTLHRHRRPASFGSKLHSWLDSPASSLAPVKPEKPWSIRRGLQNPTPNRSLTNRRPSNQQNVVRVHCHFIILETPLL